jgi:hypothetical protein
VNSIISHKRKVSAEAVQVREQHSQLMSEKQLSIYLGVSLSALRKGRSEGQHGKRTPLPPYVRVGGRVFYRLSDADRWLANLPAFSNLAEEGAKANDQC